MEVEKTLSMVPFKGIEENAYCDFICMVCGKVEKGYAISNVERSCSTCGSSMKGVQR